MNPLKLALLLCFAMIVGMSIGVVSMAGHEWLATMLGLGCAWVTGSRPIRASAPSRRPLFVPGNYSNN